MSDEKIKASVSNFYSSMFDENCCYLMPKYQRPYSWEGKHIEDFWNDLIFAVEEARNLPYLFGSIYLAKIGYSQLCDYINRDILNHKPLAPLSSLNDFYFVIDGQQRTVTFFLFLLALNDPEISSHIFNASIPKLIPGKVDYEFFLDLVSGREMQPKTKSNRRLKFTYDYFQRRLTDFPRREELKHFALRNLQIVRILVENDLKLADTLYVSQTDRGKRLTNLEKLKSTLMFYNQKIDNVEHLEGEIDNLFGSLFETIEILCSFKIYPKPENAEADVLRVINFMLLKEDFYRKYVNDLITSEADKDRKIEVYYESGEDRIYEAISKVFRESLVLRKDNIEVIIPYLTEKLKAVYSFLRYIADVGVPREQTHAYKDPYGDKTWYPFKQLFGLLGLSVYSKALMAEVCTHASLSGTSMLEPGYAIPKHAALVAIDPFEKVDRIKAAYAKLGTLEGETGSFRDIETLRPYKELIAFLRERYRSCLGKIDLYRQYAGRPATLFNIIEENELAIWKIGKRPVSNFVWEGSDAEKVVEHVRNFSFEYKQEYLIRDLNYSNYKYVLFEYERLNYGYDDEELRRVFDYDIDEDDGIQIQREHIFAQNSVDYQELKDTWLRSTNENYDDWIWKIGNVALLEQTINIGNAGNKPVWEKADYYMQSCFRGTQSLVKDIKQLKRCIDIEAATAPDKDKPFVMHLPFKLMLEIRELELLAFAFYRFA
jgi:uncharacterized protein with ParB-like and HNH nuclease domain